jgi:four helix bundle protein
VHNFKRLDVWRRGYLLSLEIVRVAESFTGVARYALGNQIVRATISISSNIAEGYGRDSNKEFRRFLAIALGSAYELDTQVQLARDLGLIPEPEAQRFVEEIDELQRMLRRLRRNTTI